MAFFELSIDVCLHVTGIMQVLGRYSAQGSRQLIPSVSICASEGAKVDVWCFFRADGRPDAFNMGSLRTELHIPAAFQSEHSIEECPETDDDSDEDADGADDEDVMVLGSTPQVHSPLHMQEGPFLLVSMHASGLCERHCWNLVF